jgi:hypothetical protein
MCLHVKRARVLWILLIVGVAFVQYGCSGIGRRYRLVSLYNEMQMLVSAQAGTARVRGTLDSGANQTKFSRDFRRTSRATRACKGASSRTP